MYNKQLTYFVVLLGCIGVLIFLQARGWLRPVESGVAEIPRPMIYVLKNAANPVKDFFSFFSSISDLNKTNASLKDQIRQLQEQNVALNEYQLENEVLKKELNYRDSTSINLISGEVIAQDPTGFSQTITLDIGQRDGVTVGAGVLAQGVLIGKITDVEDITSKALLITDPQSTVDALISGTTYSGVLRGSYGTGLLLDTISQKAQISPGLEIVTAGLTAKIPKGILIGTTDQLETGKNDLLQQVTVLSSVDLKNLYFIAVIK